MKGFSMLKEMLHATGGVNEKHYFYYLCSLDNALREYIARVRSQSGKQSWIR
jgi:hypothetical protein